MGLVPSKPCYRDQASTLISLFRITSKNGVSRRITQLPTESRAQALGLALSTFANSQANSNQKGDAASTTPSSTEKQKHPETLE